MTVLCKAINEFASLEGDDLLVSDTFDCLVPMTNKTRVYYENEAQKTIIIIWE
jgi:hypothetical protein